MLHTFYVVFICFLNILYTSHTHWRSDEGQTVATRKVEDGLPRNVWDLWGVICYHHWYPRAGLEGREKSYFSKKVLRLKKMQNHPLSIFHASVRPESLPGADLSTFQKIICSLFSGFFGSFRAQLLNFFIRRVVVALNSS